VKLGHTELELQHAQATSTGLSMPPILQVLARDRSGRLVACVGLRGSAQRLASGSFFS
jgi:hypothetical protein